MLLGILSILFFIGDYLFFKKMFVYIKSLPDTLWDILLPQFLNVICLTFFSMLIFSNIIASISTLYLSKDLELLISSPLKTRNIYISRFLQTTINSSWMFLIFGIPIFIALGTVWNATPEYFLGMILAIIPFILIPAGAGVLITTLLMRYFPARKTYQFLSTIAILFIGGLVMFLRFLEPEKILGKKEIPLELIEQYLEALKVPSYWFLPSRWISGALETATRSDHSEMWLWVAVSWAGAVAILAVCLFAASRLYYSGWSIAYSGRSSSRFHPKSGSWKIIEKLLWFVKSPLRAILLKDMKIFFRDPSQWTQVFILAALVIIYIFNIRNLPINSLFIKNFVSVMNIALAAVVISAIGVRFVFPTTSVEGKSFWLIKSAPINFDRYLWGKFFFYLFPLIFLSELLIIVSNLFLDVDSYLMLISAFGIFFLTIGLTGLGIGLGAIYPIFNHDNIAELATSTGAIYYMIVGLAYIGITVMFGLRPVWAHFSQKFLDKSVGGVEIYICYAVVLILTAAVTYIPIKMGAKSLREAEA